MSRRRVALLDVNVLVALFDADHAHHDLAHDWFADNRDRGWATCPLTENALLRVVGNPRYGSPVAGTAAMLEHLKTFRSSGHHEFWPDALSLTDETVFSGSFMRGHRQLTDVYLLGLARARGGRLATFDRSIPLGAVVGADTDTVAIIEPASSLA